MRISGWSSDVCSSDLRLLLCLYGLGTNAGLKRIAGATPDVCYEELLHVHRRFVHAAALKEACARVANATLAIRNAAVWGDAGTACADRKSVVSGRRVSVRGDIGGGRII